MSKIPRDKLNDYRHDMAQKRRNFISNQLNTSLDNVAHYSVLPETLPGNIENFVGVAQVPIGIAGPLCINGIDANGQYYVPMATTEGTLVASYNRGMRLTSLAGGITTTVIDDAMQRAPIFCFEDARAALSFGRWVNDNFEDIKAKAETTTSVGKLRDIEQYAASRMRWLRFNFTCKDAAGQNMVSKATRHACQWIIDQNPPGLTHFSLAANFDTDKKHSFVNALHTRGKRVVAEITIDADLVKAHMHCTAEQLYEQRQYSNLGAFMAGSVSNGAHFANAVSAIFIACGQDAANVAESSAGFTFSEITANGDYYFSITIPALVVATYGGGTGLATQRECLEMLDCYGQGKVNKFAEIVAATVLCGELSLSAAIVSDQWVSSHDQYGRNRP